MSSKRYTDEFKIEAVRQMTDVGPSMAIDIKSLNHNQLSELIAQAQARQAELKKDAADKARGMIAAVVKAEGLDLAEVMGCTKKGRGATKTKVRPKYRNPADPKQCVAAVAGELLASVG